MEERAQASPVEGEVLLRGTRCSLTFWDVARVMNVSVGGQLGAAPTREKREARCGYSYLRYATIHDRISLKYSYIVN